MLRTIAPTFGLTGAFMPQTLSADGVPADIDLNFVVNQGINGKSSGQASGLITCARTTAPSLGSYAQDATGKWILFPDNVPRCPNSGLRVEEPRINQEVYASTFASIWGANVGNQGFVSTDLPPLFPNAAIWKAIYGGTGDNNCAAAGGTLAILPSTTYTMSVWVYILGGTGVTQVQHTVEGAGDFPGATANANVALVNQWQQISFTGTSAATGTQSGSPVFRVQGPAGATAYFTAPQFEAGASVSSFIQNNANGTASRSADLISAPCVFGTAAISLFGDAIPLTSNSYPTNQGLLAASDGTVNNRDFIYRASPGATPSTVISGGTQIGVGGGVWNQNAEGKFLWSVSTTETSATFNGALITDTLNVGTLPAGITTLQIGNRGDGGICFNGIIRRVAAWTNHFVSNTAAIQITSTAGILSAPDSNGRTVQASVDFDLRTGIGFNQGATGPVTQFLPCLRTTAPQANMSSIVDANGNYSPVNDNVPRQNALGWLCEEQRTNNYTSSTAPNTVVATAINTNNAVGITSLSRTGSSAVANVVFNGPHGLANGNMIIIAGAADQTYNGAFNFTSTGTNTGTYLTTSTVAGTDNGTPQYSGLTTGSLSPLWGFFDRSGLTHAVVGSGVESGLNYTDIRIAGVTTSAGTNTSILNFQNPATQPVTATGQVFAHSAFAKYVGGSTANFGQLVVGIGAYNSSQGFVEWINGGGNITPVPNNVPLGLGRHSVTGITVNATDAFANGIVFANWLANVQIDVTIRWAQPQIELCPNASAANQGFPTSPIFTTAGANTRSADNNNMPFVPGSASSTFVQGVPNSAAAASNYQSALELVQGSEVSRIESVRVISTAQAGLFVQNTNGTFPQTIFGVWPNLTRGSIAGAVANNDQSAAFNGTVQDFPTPTIWPPTTNVNTIQVGSQANGLFSFNGWIERIAVWFNSRISDPGLQNLTGTIR
jgi:hypothetical protein